MSLLSVVKIWDAERKRHPTRSVRIWSFNKRLKTYGVAT